MEKTRVPKAEKDCHKPMTKFCEVFDWLMERGLRIVIEPSWDFANERITDMWDCDIVKVGAFSSQPKTTSGGSTALRTIALLRHPNTEHFICKWDGKYWWTWNDCGREIKGWFGLNTGWEIVEWKEI